ncbi:MAG: hypothetical protein FWG66_15235 [Spirochaetes bacterium]|nr:hypothetical protein [Spirochaetota bacterium]
MKRKNISKLAILAACALWLAGCAQPPTEEMNNAIEAVTRAENDPNAVLYAQGTLLMAQDALRRMQDEADLRNFDDARFFAGEAVMFANMAISQGAAAAQRSREEAEALLLALSPEVEQTEQAILSAQENGLALDYDALDRDLQTARIEAEEAQLAMAENRYSDALEMGMNARNGINGINQALSTAVAAVAAKQ